MKKLFVVLTVAAFAVAANAGEGCCPASKKKAEETAKSECPAAKKDAAAKDASAKQAKQAKKSTQS